MTAFTITCPNPKCGRPLNLPADAIGKPLSCPYCRTAIGVTLGPDGQPAPPQALGGTWRVPKMFLVPGFALLILGFAGAFVNGYIAADAAARPEVALEHGRRMVGDLRSFEGLTGPSRESKGKGEPTPQDLFAAVAGQAARVSEQERADAALAAGWAPYMVRYHLIFAVVSLAAGVGGLAILRGRWYWLAILGCVASILNLNFMCCMPGAVAGIWGLLMLARDEGRRHFGRRRGDDLCGRGPGDPAVQFSRPTTPTAGVRMPLTSFYNTNLPPHLRVLKDEIEGYARGYGLDFFETIFEVIDADDLNEIAAYGGFPTRYPHWSFGMQYEELKRSYEYGLSKIYEMVINNDPCYAYLMRCNHVVDQKLVMAHVYGHCDFFKNNAFFAHTTRKMMDEIANHGARIRRYVERFGEDEVEAFMDRCQSIDDLIDIHSVAIKRRDDAGKYEFKPATDDGKEEEAPRKFKSKPYLDEFMNPRAKEEDDTAAVKTPQEAPSFPDHPEKDVLLFLIEHAPLKNWQRDVLSIVRDEAYYFYPQAQTKIMNEGWASYWHSTIMTQKVLQPSEMIDYADHHSGTMATSGRRLNPYKVGIELLRDVERRWNTGQFGPEWENCDDAEKRRTWNKDTGLGRQKIFEVRKVHNDITFIDTFLTPEFCKEYKLFSFNYQQPTKNYVIESREFEMVKQRLLASLTNFGKPWIEVVNGNHRNRGELLLRHRYSGVELKLNEAQDTLANVRYIWGRPVHLETVIDDKPTLLSFDGQDHTKQVIGADNDPRRNPAQKPK